MNDAGKRVGRLENAMYKLFARNARVASIESLSEHFLDVRLEGEALRHVDWTPGDKIQVLFGGWVQRTYTPFEWDAARGRTRFLVYLHGDGPSAQWARALNMGDDCVLFGPRSSVDLTKGRSTMLVFGDETTVGLARAWDAVPIPPSIPRLLLEVSAPTEVRTVLERLGVRTSHDIVQRLPDDSHVAALAERALTLYRNDAVEHVVLTGKAGSIQTIRRHLLQHGAHSGQFQNKAYWAPGKKGLD